MRRLIVVSLVILLSYPAAHAAVPSLRISSSQGVAIHSQRMTELAPSLRDWVIEEARRTASSTPDPELISHAVRTRLAGQDYSAVDVDVLVQMIMMECAEMAEADLRATMAEMRASNEQRRAMRESAQARALAENEQKGAMRESYRARAQVQPPVKAPTVVGPALRVRPAVATTQLQFADPVEEDKDTLSDLGEEQGLRLQMVQERRAKAFEALSNMMEKSSETASSIISNLK